MRRNKQLAAEAMRISAPEVAALGCVDEIIAEPPGACTPTMSRDRGCWAPRSKHLAELKALPMDVLVAARQQKFRNIAQFYTEPVPVMKHERVDVRGEWYAAGQAGRYRKIVRRRRP
jgi:hypothetical protein